MSWIDETTSKMQSLSTADVLTYMVTCALVVPIALAVAKGAVVSWLLEHEIAAAAGAGVFTVPWLDVDVPARTVLVLVLVVVAAALIARLVYLRRAAQRIKALAAAKQRGGQR